MIIMIHDGYDGDKFDSDDYGGDYDDYGGDKFDGDDYGGDDDSDDMSNVA